MFPPMRHDEVSPPYHVFAMTCFANPKGPTMSCNTLAVIERGILDGTRPLDGTWIECADPTDPRDSGIAICSDAVPPTRANIDAYASVCVHCLLQRRPDLGPGLAVAMENGGAAFDNNAWQVVVFVEGNA